MRLHRCARLLIFLCLCSLPSCNRPQAPPNMLWITVEDMSPRIPAYGDHTVTTPHLDRLAAEGIRYTHAFSVSGVCAPSRATLITGLYPMSMGALHMRTLSRTASIAEVTDPEALSIPVYEAVPPPEVRCFPEWLRRAGYYCTNNAKEDYQFRAPVTVWDESSPEAHWRNRPEGMPFFSVFNFTTTHESQVWRRADEPLLVSPEEVEVPPYYPDTPTVRRDLARHYSNIQIMDGQVGEILEQLEEDGLADNTIVFFFSDHGDGLPRAKRWLYDSGLHVPLMIRFPDGRQAGTSTDRLVSFVDFAPTVLSLLSVPLPDYLEGRPFLGDAQAASPRDYIFASKDRMDPAIDTSRAVRDRRFKYIHNYRPERPFVQFVPYRNQMPLMQELLRLDREGRLEGPEKLWFRDTKPAEELYDTTADPHELTNLAGHPEYAEILERMSKVETQWVVETGDPLTMPEEELVRRLWGPDGEQPVTASPETAIRRENGVFEVTLSCPTEGASIGYRLGSDERWLVYHESLALESGVEVTAVAHRIGFQPSPPIEFTVP